MELPFAVEASTDLSSNVIPLTPSNNATAENNDDDACSLVTASSQGSLVQSQTEYEQMFSNQHSNAPSTSLSPQTAPKQPPQPHLAENTGLKNQSPYSINSSSRTVPPSHHHKQPTTLDQPKPSTFSSSLVATGSRVASVLSHLTTTAATSLSGTTEQQQQQARTRLDEQQRKQQPLETVDFFTYVNVWETDADEVDILLPNSSNNPLEQKANQESNDILTLLLNRTGSTTSGEVSENADRLVDLLEQANQSAHLAAQAKQQGNLQQALDYHTKTAKIFHHAAILAKPSHVSMANSLLLLSQVQAKLAVALQRAVKLRPSSLASLLKHTVGETHGNETTDSNARLRATVRGALDSRPEADISESIFLGKATSGPANNTAATSPVHGDKDSTSTAEKNQNPVDEMMALERELRDMDMALELGNSIVSLETRNQSRTKNLDGSFMVVPPGSGSYMSSSSMWSPPTSTPGPRPAHPPTPSSRTAGVRARANRVQNMLEASTSRPPHPATPLTTSTSSIAGGSKHPPHHLHQQQQQQSHHHPQGLESSWWGTSSVTSAQALTSSVISLASSMAHDGGGTNQQHPANTKQLMRLMDSLKTLGDENAALLHEVQQAEAARLEAKMAREEISRFKEEYGKRFTALRQALKKFREEYAGSDSNPVSSSEFVQSESTTDQLQRQENLIKKLTSDLKKEKEESKKKDAALRKYESFYKEVKARSAQKAAQRQKETRQRNRVAPSR